MLGGARRIFIPKHIECQALAPNQKQRRIGAQFRNQEEHKLFSFAFIAWKDFD